MNRYTLKPFQAPPSPFTVQVDSLVLDNELTINFTLVGNIASLNLPAPKETTHRVEGLFHHTCLEIFLKRESRYIEYNFAFSGDWCIFLFDGYRKSISPDITLDSSFFSVKHISNSNSEANFNVRIYLSKLGILGTGETRLGISSIIEHPQCQLSYWALTHVGEKPDFHNEQSFIPLRY